MFYRTERSAAFWAIYFLFTVMLLAACGGGGGGGGTGGGAPGTNTGGPPGSASGRLDAGFGVNGKVVTSLGKTRNAIYGMTVQPDGKTIIVGEMINATLDFFVLARFNVDGTFDNSFGNDGKVVTPFGSRFDFLQAIILQPDGKIVVAGGYFNGNDYDFGLLRFQSNGDPDPSFGIEGGVTTPIGFSDESIRAIGIQTDGKIVVAGFSRNGSNNDFAVVRYLTDGHLDLQFGTAGKVVTSFGSGDESILALAIQADGKIVTGGSVDTGSTGINLDFGMARYNTNGGLDLSFGSGGKVVTAVGVSDDFIRAITIQPDGKIIAGGESYDGLGFPNFALARFDSNGSLDPLFGSGGGKIVTPVGQAGAIFSVALQQDGKIVGAGYASVGNNEDFALVRFNMDGSLDDHFGAGGKVTTAIWSGSEFIESVIIQTDGKLVAAGRVFQGKNEDTGLLRYNLDGSLDQTFGTEGGILIHFGEGDDFLLSVAVQPDGKVIAAGWSFNGFDNDFALVRYHSNGNLDTTFGNEGKVITDFGFGGDGIRAMVIQPDGKIVVGGETFNGINVDFALARYQPSGLLDPEFGNGGMVTVGIGPGDNRIYALALAPDGKIVAAGSFYNGSSDDFALVRLQTNGALDTTLGQRGVVRTGIGGGDDIAQAVKLQSDGKIVAAGMSESGGIFQAALVRYDSNGARDLTFGIVGVVTSDWGPDEDLIAAMEITSDGKILVAGQSLNERDDDFFLARYEQSGGLDPTFGNNGTVRTAIGTGGEAATSLVLQSDGKIIAAGISFNGENDDFAVVRYQPDGDLDPTFGEDGKITTPIGLGDDSWGMALQPDGKIVVAGNTFHETNGFDFALVRYLP